ncbi:hypothetical protein T265_07633 [Opisthorchis viverrini]|uniref:Uncharacterized protein n=1 Tax=Opisthorchis viverrini TaxID=6198 RepID=A0A075AAZ3_OPIVI|nr:hypothetical protein T265_07633 [Opisthorchis viverrini]KER24744.1 hypothetical protein T265_07633 [Opisthorchis viverrini]
MTSTTEVCIICLVQLVLYFICIIIGYLRLWAFRIQPTPHFDRLEDTGVIRSDKRIIVNPGALSAMLMYDPVFELDPPTFEEYAGVKTMRALAEKATRRLLRNSVTVTNLPVNLALLRRSLMMLDSISEPTEMPEERPVSGTVSPMGAVDAPTSPYPKPKTTKRRFLIKK